jgi:hypothetical protein|tara:strand:- start:9023 stop:9196 length:174 start_codon:yes stop_codon:yes gene_type:complete
MASIAATDVSTKKGTLEVVIAEMEVLLEAIDDSKTLFVCDIYHIGGNRFQGAIIHAD